MAVASLSASRSSSSSQKTKFPEAFEPLFQPSRYKAFYGGRASAKSHSFAAAILLRGGQKPIRVLCAREIQRSIRDSVKRLLDDKIRDLGLGSFYSSVENEIRGRNGSLIVFAGLRTNPDTIKSMEGIDIAWVEEAHTVSQTGLDILRPTIRTDESEVWFSWNPRFENDPVDVMFRGGEPPPNSIIRKVSFKDNPWLSDVTREDMAWDLRRDPDKYRHIWLGEYIKNSEARVFRNWTVEAFETPDNLERFYFGADWGFSIDPTVLVRCWIDGRTLYVDQEIYRVGCEIDKTPDLFTGIPGSQKWPIVADSARPETISYMQRHGFRNIKPAKKGPGSVEDGVEFLKNYDIKVHPRCRHTADELSLYSYKVDKLTDEVLPVLEDKKNHVIDALRYAVEGLRRAGSGPNIR